MAGGASVSTKRHAYWLRNERLDVEMSGPSPELIRQACSEFAGIGNTQQTTTGNLSRPPNATTSASRTAARKPVTQTRLSPQGRQAISQAQKQRHAQQVQRQKSATNAAPRTMAAGG